MTYIPYLGTFFSHGTPVWPWPVIYIDHKIKMNIPERGFPLTRLAMSPRGGLTMGRTAEGRFELVELSIGTGSGVPTHTPGPALSNRMFPPTGSRHKTAGR